MQMYLAGMENQANMINYKDCEFGLMSFFYLKNNQDKFNKSSEHINHILIDSGAHSFQHGVVVDWEAYTRDFADFIKRNTDNPKIEGFFEMDVDNVIGYERVLQLRKILEEVSDKIIPVWHNSRGIADYIEMCKKYAGKRISITGFKDGDITEGQYNLFVNTAHKYGCKIHILGMTRPELIKTLNLGKDDSFDSSSWIMAGAYGALMMNPKRDEKFMLESLGRVPGLPASRYHTINYVCYRKMQEYYKDIDRSVEIENDGR